MTQQLKIKIVSFVFVAIRNRVYFDQLLEYNLKDHPKPTDHLVLNCLNGEYFYGLVVVSPLLVLSKAD
jgi:hypothetical protein